MFIKTDYTTNGIPGSFFRPNDYMAHVPTERITGTDRVSFSEEGMQLSKQIDTSKYVKSAGFDVANISTNNKNSHIIRRYVYNSAADKVNMVNIAV